MGKYFLCGLLLIFSTAFAKPKSSFQKFTGRVVGNKVRIRAKADLDGKIIMQQNKDDLVLVIGDDDAFWAIQPPDEVKAYIFRSYVLENIVEANRVNVRLAPSIEAPVISQLESGTKVVGDVCNKNRKWLEITPPKNTKFYISKEFISYAGSPDYFNNMTKRKNQVTNLLDQAYTVYQEESRMPFDSMSPKSFISLLEKIIKEYSDFSSKTNEAKKLLVKFKENYLEKKLAYMEEKSLKADQINDDSLFPKIKIEEPKKPISIVKNTVSNLKLKGSIQFWNAIESSLYENWLTFHNNRNVKDFYKEQRANAMTLTGVLAPYSTDIQNRPGDFLLKDKGNVPFAFLYSTKIDLSKYSGKEVKILAVPRPNNHFAYPAYFVLDLR